MHSHADHSILRDNTLHLLTQEWVEWFHSHDMVKTTLQHLAAGAESHPLTPQQQLDLGSIAYTHLCPSLDASTAMQISDGQRFRLNILHAFAEHMKDPEIGMPALLQEGVPTGRSTPRAGRWTALVATCQGGQVLGTKTA